MNRCIAHSGPIRVAASIAAIMVCGLSAAAVPWVTDEEREFMKNRVKHIDVLPGTPEGDAKRFYSNDEKTEYVEFNYDEAKSGEGTYKL